MDRKFALLVQLWPPDFPWRWPKSKKISSSGEKLQPLVYLNMAKSRLYSSLLFRKNTIIICNIWANFARKQGRVTNKRVSIKIWQNFVNLLKHFGSNIFLFCSYRSQRTFQKNFNGILSLAAFLGTMPTFLKKMNKLPETEFNSGTIDTSFKS